MKLRHGATWFFGIVTLVACSGSGSSGFRPPPMLDAGTQDGARATGGSGHAGGGEGPGGGAGAGGLAGGNGGTGGAGNGGTVSDAAGPLNLDAGAHVDCATFCRNIETLGCSSTPGQSDCEALCSEARTTCSIAQSCFACTTATPSAVCNSNGGIDFIGCPQCQDLPGRCGLHGPGDASKGSFDASNGGKSGGSGGSSSDGGNTGGAASGGGAGAGGTTSAGGAGAGGTPLGLDAGAHVDCTALCGTILDVGCANGPSPLECTTLCNELKGTCTVAQECFSCVTSNPTVHCDASGGVAFDGCPECVDLPTQCGLHGPKDGGPADAPAPVVVDCAKFCENVQASGCSPWLDASTCQTFCNDASTSCGAASDCFACTGSRPTTACGDAGELVFPGCSACDSMLLKCGG